MNVPQHTIHPYPPSGFKSMRTLCASLRLDFSVDVCDISFHLRKYEAVCFFQFLYERMCQLSEAIEYDQCDMKRDHQRAKNEPHQGQIGVVSVGLCPRTSAGRLFMPVQEMKWNIILSCVNHESNEKTYAWVEISVFLLSRIIITLLIMPDYSNHVSISISAGH